MRPLKAIEFRTRRVRRAWIPSSLRRPVFVRDLQRLHDVLATTALDGHYSICGGLLLGWARDGRVLADDLYDADFTFFAEYVPAFESAAHALARAGFEPDVRYVNNEGFPVLYRFRRHGAQFEFYALWRIADRVRYFMYDGQVELVCERADHELEPFVFLNRTWLKPTDHESALTANYRDWRTPRRDWHHSDAGTVIQRHQAKLGREKWDGAAAQAAHP
jgi:hypothetical protein